MSATLAAVSEELTIGQVAERTGLSTHTLRFYEQEGLFVAPVPRSPAGHRLYTAAHVEWLETCKRLRETGLPLEEIRRFVELVGDDAPLDEQVAVLRRHHERLTAELDELAGRLGRLSRKIRAVSGETC